MSRSLASCIKGIHEGDSAEVVLKRSTEVLLGVDVEAAEILASLSIKSVFDLASSHLFESAYKLAQETEGRSSVFDHVGAIPGDIVDPDLVSASPTDIAQAGIQVLREIGTGNSDKITKALGVSSVRDLGRWPPYHAARTILNLVYSIDTGLEPDPEAPDELVPVARRYATESFRYKRVYFDQVERDSGMELRDLSGAKPLDIRSLRLGDGSKMAPATGALMVFEQTWKPQGLSLGQLLSSVALAPGESTKIAVIDWSRRVATAASEDVNEQDQIQAEISQDRSTSEIQKLAAQEMTTGFSNQSTSSYSEGGGYSDGGGIAGLFGGGSVNENYGFNEGSTTTVASSGGSRDLQAEMAQEIQGLTLQASTAIRSRRAALVTETTTSETEEIRTRILTNYNHSHALTIQYYEVVQIFRTAVNLTSADRVLFVPIKTIDFRDPAVLAEFKNVLINAITDPSVRRSLASFINDVQLQEMNTFRAKAVTYQVEGDLFLKSAGIKTSKMIRGDVSLVIEMRDGEKVELEFKSNTGVRTLDEPIAMSDLLTITVDYLGYRGDLAQNIDLWLVVAPRETMSGLKGFHFRSGLTGSSSANSSQPERFEQRIVSAYVEGMDPNTIDYLQEHALPLSQAIWASLNQQKLATILGGYEFRGAPLLEVVDVDPITFFGNYLVLRYYPTDDDGLAAWSAWKERHLSQEAMSVEEELIPVPSDGLFAEAVLGRFNASEKIDMTRFWDWQESPIPMQAPDIGPIAAGNHVSGAAPVPGQLGPSIVGMQSPQALPNPTGLAPIIAAAQSDLFRDMSGLQQTAETLRASLDESSELSVNAGKLANEIEAIKQKTVGKLAEMAAQAGLAAAGGGLVGGSGSSGGGVSGATGTRSGGQLMSGPAAGMSNTTRGGLLNESLKLDEGLMQMPDLDWPAPGAKGSHTGTTMGSTRGFDPEIGTGTPAQYHEPAEAPEKKESTEKFEERRDSLNAPFKIERHKRTGHDSRIFGGEPLFEWHIYDFGIGNADPGVDNNIKDPVAIREKLTQRIKHLVEELDVWVDIEVYGYTDNYGNDQQNEQLRLDRAIAAIDWFIPAQPDSREDWVDTISGEVINAPINVTLIKGAPLDRYIAENGTPAGRAKNRSVVIIEKKARSVKPGNEVWATPQEVTVKKQEISDQVDQIRSSNSKVDRQKRVVYDVWMDPHADMRAFDWDSFMAMIPIVSQLPGDTEIDFFKYTVDHRRRLDDMLKNSQKNSVSIFAELDAVIWEMERVAKEMEQGYRTFDRGGLNRDSWIKKFDKWQVQQMKTPDTLYSAFLSEFPENLPD